MWGFQSFNSRQMSTEGFWRTFVLQNPPVTQSRANRIWNQQGTWTMAGSITGMPGRDGRGTIAYTNQDVLSCNATALVVEGQPLAMRNKRFGFSVLFCIDSIVYLCHCIVVCSINSIVEYLMALYLLISIPREEAGVLPLALE